MVHNWSSDGMEDEKSLETVLRRFMGAADIGDARLASLVNKQVGITGFLHRSTVRNWRNGSSKSVKDWRQMAAIAAALDLNQDDTDQLLFAGGCPPITALQKMASDDDQSFLARWQPADVEPLPDSEPEPAESNNTPALPPMSSTWPEHATAPQKQNTAVSTILKIALPALLTIALFYGARTWFAGGESAAPSPIFSDQMDVVWDFSDLSWDVTAELIETNLAIEGEKVLNVTLQEYGGLTFSNVEPIQTEPYHFLQFYIRRSDSDESEKVTLNVLIDDDDHFGNGEVGRAVINNYIEGNEGDITAGVWHKVKIPLNIISPEPFAITQLVIHSPVNGKKPHFWLDQIQLVGE